MLTWTVLQHLSPPRAESTSAAIESVVAPGGWVVICEQTNEDPADHVWGRDPGEYEALLSGLELVATADRELEPSYGPYDGTDEVMVFRNPE